MQQDGTLRKQTVTYTMGKSSLRMEAYLSQSEDILTTYAVMRMLPKTGRDVPPAMNDGMPEPTTGIMGTANDVVYTGKTDINATVMQITTANGESSIATATETHVSTATATSTATAAATATVESDLDQPRTILEFEQLKLHFLGGFQPEKVFLLSVNTVYIFISRTPFLFIF